MCSCAVLVKKKKEEGLNGQEGRCRLSSLEGSCCVTGLVAACRNR